MEFFSVVGLSPFLLSEITELPVFKNALLLCLAKPAGIFSYLGRPDAILYDEIDRVWFGLQGEVLTAVRACAMGSVLGSRLRLAGQSGGKSISRTVMKNLRA